MDNSNHGYGENWCLYDPLFTLNAANTGVPFEWLKAICMNESSLGLDPSVAIGLKNPGDVEGSKSQDGRSWGLMQLTLPTARDFDVIVTPQKLNDPAYSIRTASLLLKRLRRLFQNTEVWCVKAYNQGEGNTALEKNGKIRGSAADYWQRYLNHKDLILQIDTDPPSAA